MNEWMNFILPNNTTNPVKYFYTLHTFTHIHTIHTSANSVGDVAYRRLAPWNVYVLAYTLFLVVKQTNMYSKKSDTRGVLAVISMNYNKARLNISANQH